MSCWILENLTTVVSLLDLAFPNLGKCLALSTIWNTHDAIDALCILFLGRLSLPANFQHVQHFW